MSVHGKFTYVDYILLLTAFAAGAVDVISFAQLGGVFASAMTGNLALLAFYVSHSDAAAAMGSVIALTGFVIGCALGILQRRGRPQSNALSLILASQTGLLLFYSLYAMWTSHAGQGRSDDMRIALLSIAMGLQAIAGQTISRTSIVFTTTLAKLVGTIADSIANGSLAVLRDVKLQSAVVVSYLFGALMSGALIIRRIDAVALLPFIAVAWSLTLHLRANRTAV